MSDVTNIYTPPPPGYIRVNGQDVPYTPPSASPAGGGKWSSTPATGMGDLAKNVNSQASNKMEIMRARRENIFILDTC